ncbi:hypothetical protein PPL_11802 [Heterostelium album PN500]|uniref:Flavin-containing monooxygenase n=1 Tax=Heterostelium pallidum (strain ATCC 26659 / Pp 5 / PN500) TaxID=670386 RepID=D3BUI2_HETP5|nr:hypothetical protein PPL_11802 [Heterostelium album PN500]EFA74770.1 hypothetical protein PPL_11802 [Heterostelium album PN500]|eukprot:XP_020426904.1 hypothetical protein PPL_11802 [Heterostelium album PN500]
MDNISKSVAIIGAGPSGLVSCKSALECGLLPTVFEKNSDVGGIWSVSSGKVWDSLHTNLSVHTMMFSDFPWESEWYSKDFPPHTEVIAYLDRYARHFKLYPHIRLNSTVISVYSDGKKWIVESITTTAADGSKSEVKNKESFDSIIIASGMLEYQRPLNIVDIEKFTGTISHGRDYKNAGQFTGDSFLVIGDSYSGCEIAAELTMKSADVSVTQLMKRPSWILEKYLPSPPTKPDDPPKLLPLDFLFFSRVGIDFFATNFKTLPEAFKVRHEMLSQMCAKQQSVKHLQHELPKQDCPSICISDNYTDIVKSGKIDIHPQITGIEGKTVHFSSGESKEIDHIILACGFSYELPFLDHSVLKDIDYDPNERVVPIILHKTVFHPTMANIGFVGWYVAALFPIIELQARWLTLVLSEQVDAPTKEQIEAGMNAERAIRDSPIKLRIPHMEMPVIGDDLAAQFGALPDLQKIKDEDPHLYHLIYNNFASPASYRLTGPYANAELATKILNDINNKYYINSK